MIRTCLRIALGAALIAGVGVGVFPDERTAARLCARVVDTAVPIAQNVALYDKLFAIYKDAQKGLEKVNHALSALTG